ncbi:MAG: DNA-binding protein [Chloroflexi bacterium HGW-Chloroflexi-5]|jgi:predicted DNA-binding transcriptional regulator AlpA|nr:MAG: DNA-binding protein [Chloroflexi bacterium HGW-Chloroflexi-5]
MANQSKKTLTPREFAECYGFSEGTLANLRCQKRGPKYYRVGKRKILYYVDDIEKWIRLDPVLTIDSLPE